MKSFRSVWLAASATALAGAVFGEQVVLNEASSWRMFHVLAPPVTESGGKLSPYLHDVAWMDTPTAEPPVGWQKPEFDDATWLRTTLRNGVTGSAFLARQCLRGRFIVESPARAGALSLALRFQGGAIVYLNGVEIARRYVATGATAIAESYAPEAFFTENGDLLAGENSSIGPGQRAGRPGPADARRIAGRERTLEIHLPPAGVRQGLNVIAIELIRAPYPAAMTEPHPNAQGRRRFNRFDWATCQVNGATLTAAGSGIVSSGQRPKGPQLWNLGTLERAFNRLAGDVCEPLRPVRIVAARNGMASGVVMVGSDQAIRGLTATAELRGPGGPAPANALQIRYGALWGSSADESARDGFYGAIAERPPAEVKPAAGAPEGGGAAIPVWLTVRVPAGTTPGRYDGRLTIRADGWKALEAPVELWVADYTLPDAQNYRTWVELIQVPDVTSVEYGAPLWSDRHFELIARSFRLIRDTGTRIVYIPAIAHTNLGNAESMIRWIPKGDGYTWDFSAMERYLDLATKELGTPKVVVLQVWDIYMATRDSIGKRFGPEMEQRHAAIGGNVPLVTLLDPATKQTRNETAPALNDPRSKAIWGELLRQVQERLKARGLANALMFGMFTDAVPPKEHIAFFHSLAPNVPWVQQGHHLHQDKLYGIATFGYQASVWGGYRFGDGLKQTNQLTPPIVASLKGWKRPTLDAVFERNMGLTSYPPTRWYFFPETCVTSELRGLGRIGADYWQVVKDNRGRRISWAHDRFPEGMWGGSTIGLLLCLTTLAPGEDGPMATTHLEALIRGVQAAEARIFIERALDDSAMKSRLGPELAGRCQAALDRRLNDMWRALSNFALGLHWGGATMWRWVPAAAGHRWYLGYDYARAEADLFALAGEVQKRLPPGTR